MKQQSDTQTQDAFPKDVFDLTHADDWPFPEALPEWQPKHKSAYHLARPEGVLVWEEEPREKTLREWLIGILKL